MLIEENDGNIEQVEQSTEGANTENSPAPGSDNQAQKTTPGGANAGANDGQSEKLFHKNPEVQTYLDRQRKNWERDSNRKIEELQRTYDKKFQEIQNSSRTKQDNPGLSDQDASQLRQLAKLIKSDPEAAKILGLDGISSLQEKFDSMSSSQVERQVQSEFNSIIDDYSKKYGYDSKELAEDLEDFITNDPIWSSQDMKPGIMKKAANDFFSGRQQELSDKAANMKLVTENQNKSKAGSQKPLGSNQATTEKAPTSMKEAIRMAIKKQSNQGAALGD